MAFFQYLTIVVLVIVNLSYADGINIRNVDTDRLIWAPITRLKSPFMTFINDFNFPTWITRHQMTKRNERSHLQLAKAVPFTVVCGACYMHSSLKPNLTISISDHHSISVPKRRNDRSSQYSVGVNECLMTYLITEPIKKDGVITCTLNRGKQVIKEVVTFEAVDVEIQEPPKEFEIQTSESPIELNCPTTEEVPMKNNPTMNVWHEEYKPSDEKTVGSPILSTKPTVYLEQPRYTITIVCSVYNIVRPDVVHQRRFKIQGRRTNAKSEYHVSSDILNYEEDSDILPPKISLSSSILAIVIMAAVVCVLLGVIGLYRFLAAARNN